MLVDQTAPADNFMVSMTLLSQVGVSLPGEKYHYSYFASNYLHRISRAFLLAQQKYAIHYQPNFLYAAACATFGMDQACIDTTMSDQECQMPKKIDDVVHVCSIVAMEAMGKGCYLQETCNKAPESYQQKTRHESPGDVVTGHHAMLGDVPLSWTVSYARGGEKALTD